MENQQVIAAGIGMGQSARWQGGRFWFADWNARLIHAIDPDGTEHQSFAVPSFPITFDWLPDGELLVVSGAAGELLTLTPIGTFARRATLSELSETPWNEIVTRGEQAYVNCIGYAYPGPAQVSGLIALVKPDGGATVVAESNAGFLTAFHILADGSLANRHVWAAVPGNAPDGICLGDGGIWYADVPRRCCVLVARGGEVLHTIELEQGCFSCAVGGEDANTLLVLTADWPGALQTGAVTGRAVAVRLDRAPQ